MIPGNIPNLVTSPRFTSVRSTFTLGRRTSTAKNTAPNNNTTANMMTSQRVQSFALFLLLLFVLILPLLVLMPSIHHFTSQTGTPVALARPRAPSPGLTVITLNYLQATNSKNIEHNCRMIVDNSDPVSSSTHLTHRFVIYTDNMTSPYCRLCECRLFKPYNCPCAPGGSACDGRNACEKLYFITDMIQIFDEFVFLDNDLIIIQPIFLQHLFQRSREHDFLASYGHDFSIPQTYHRNFNSGLFFIRKQANLNYTMMRNQMYELKAEKDQPIVSWFIQSYYMNWDSLSYKWHCRFLRREKQDIPPEHCYTLHDRAEAEDILQQLNMTRLTIDN